MRRSLQQGYWAFGLRLAVAVIAALVLAISCPTGGAFVSSALAVEPDEVLSDARLEARARDISAGLRCVVCQNQSIDDSNAPLAKDLRVLVRERLKAGDSDRDILDFIVARYGAFVLLKPPFGLNTLLLWLTPLLLLAGVGAYITVRLRDAKAAPKPAPLSANEQARLDSLMRDNRQ